ncbi:MAG: hypothetical protein AAGC93_23300 [Cyanobacteria bacterium P01_F01_bin.53]
MLIHHAQTSQQAGTRYGTKKSSSLSRILLQWMGLPLLSAVILAGVSARAGVVLSSPDQAVTAVKRFVVAKTQAAALPTVKIDVKYKHVYTLQQQREAALKTGVVASDKENFVPAKLQYGGRTIPISLRLRPGSTASLKTEQWAYQIEVENDDRPFGLKRFSLYTPDPESFLQEHAWLEHLRKEGLLARTTHLAQLDFNGSAKGTVILEDEFSKELLKEQLRPEGLFLKYSTAADLPPVTSTRVGHIEKYFGLQRQQDWAIALLEDFRAGALPANHFFNVEATAKYLAIASLWPEASGLAATQTHFYYDPLTAKLEPVGFHYQPNAIAEPTEVGATHWVEKLLQDPQIAAAYAKERQRLMKPNYLAQLQSELTDSIKAQPALLNGIKHNKPLDALWEGLTVRLAQPDALRTMIGDLPLPAVPFTPWISHGRTRIAPTVKDLLAQHPFLSWSQATQTLSIKSGEWAVSGDLIIPEGLQVEAASGTQLRFESDAMFISRSPLKFVGSESSPIVLGPQRKVWGGLEVWNAGQSSILDQVEIRHTLGGSLFYRSPVSLRASRLIGSEARDGLRLIRSPFLVSDSDFESFVDDAIDTDFADGSIENTRFSNIGGDGIDLGHSRVNVRDVEMFRLADKAISVGQNSELVGEDISIRESAIAVAAIDGSSAMLHGLTLSDIEKVGLAAYQDRMGFEPSRMEATGVTFQGTEKEVLVQTGSQLQLNKAEVDNGVSDNQLLYALDVLE